MIAEAKKKSGFTDAENKLLKKMDNILKYEKCPLRDIEELIINEKDPHKYYQLYNKRLNMQVEEFDKLSKEYAEKINYLLKGILE